MGAISIWHWLIVMLSFGVPVVLCIWTAKRSPTHPDGGPVGFGGWLLLLAIGQTLAPLKTLASLVVTIQAFDEVGTMPGGNFAMFGEVALMIAFLVLQLVVAALMYRRSSLFPRFFLVQLFALAIFFVVDALLVASLGVASSEVAFNQVYTPYIVGGYVGSFLGTALWTLYVFKSRRVRNTLVRGALPIGIVVENG